MSETERAAPVFFLAPRCGPARASICRRDLSTRSRTSAPARCRCSASSGRPARRPRPTTPTAPRPPFPRLKVRTPDAAHRAHRACRLGREPRAWRGLARRRERRLRAAALFPPFAHRRPRRQDEPRGAARRGARRLHHDVPRGRADESRHAAGAPRRDRDDPMDEVEGQGHQIVGSWSSSSSTRTESTTPRCRRR